VGHVGQGSVQFGLDAAEAVVVVDVQILLVLFLINQSRKHLYHKQGTITEGDVDVQLTSLLR
jgi:hypothetical protein